ncbi:hypothetical protein P775_16175 [Puniceibacterium antarcticum]|uniref:YrhK domain-containing protein n=1 Tax=Puniceibacterium antarcticum TaxID=1206336 RepID=A0A2G8RC49_9RHOB|nr:YrhK family protein [Puniceibacterium antarcticum]PIL19117.1 hypothetical protein P775_16175 [Puniceibacterium antarcticum]
MKLFDHKNRERNDHTRRIYALYEIAHTAVDFLAAVSFLIGSVLFLFPDYETPAVWLFILGSVFFMAKPTLRLLREIQLYRMGQLDSLAGRSS